MSFDMNGLLSSSSRTSSKAKSQSIEMDLLRGVSNQSEESSDFSDRLREAEEKPKPTVVSGEKPQKSEAVKAKKPAAPEEVDDPNQVSSERKVSEETKVVKDDDQPVKEQAVVVDAQKTGESDESELLMALLPKPISMDLVKDDGKAVDLNESDTLSDVVEQSMTSVARHAAAELVSQNKPKDGIEAKEVRVEKLNLQSMSESELQLDVDLSIDERQINQTSLDFDRASSNQVSLEAGDAAEEIPAAAAPSLKRFADDLFISKSIGIENTSLQRTDALTSLEAPEAPRPVKVIDQIQPIVSKLALNANGGEMTIKLYPAHLGAVKVQVQVREDLVRVYFEAEKLSTQNLIREQAADLKSHLNQQGLKVDDLQIAPSSVNGLDTSQRSQSASERNQPQWDQQQREAREHKEHGKQNQGRDSKENFESHFEERNAA